MALGLNTSSNVPSIVTAYAKRRTLVRAQPRLHYSRVTQAEALPMHNGKTLRARRYTKLPQPAAPLVEGIPPSGQRLAYTEVSCALQQWGDFVPYTDVAEWTTDHPILGEITDLQGEQAAETKDSLVRDVAQGGTNVSYGGGVASRSLLVATTEIITATVLKKVRRALEARDARTFMGRVMASTGVGTSGLPESYLAITTPEVGYDLRNITGFVPVEDYPSQAQVLPGEIGHFDGIRFMQSTNGKRYLGGGGSSTAVATTGGVSDVHVIHVFGKDAIADVPLTGKSMETIIKKLGSGDDPLNQRGTIGWKHNGARMILNDAFMHRIEVAVSL